MIDDLSTAQDCVVASFYYLTRVDLADVYAFVVGLVLMTVFFRYFNKRYG